jgi:hypothetical protein
MKIYGNDICRSCFLGLQVSLCGGTFKIRVHSTFALLFVSSSYESISIRKQDFPLRPMFKSSTTDAVPINFLDTRLCVALDARKLMTQLTKLSPKIKNIRILIIYFLKRPCSPYSITAAPFHASAMFDSSGKNAV